MLKQNWVYKFIVFSPSNQEILISRENQKVSLPSFKTQSINVALTDHINSFFKKEFQLDTNVLHCFIEKGNTRIYMVEMIEGYEATYWLPISEVEKLTDEDEKLVLQEYFSTYHPSVPWFKLGWRSKMEAWVGKELGPSNLTFTQLRSWERSSLFRISSSKKAFYLKAVPEVFLLKR